MKNLFLGNSNLEASQVALGCMRIWQKSEKEIENLIRTSMDLGINFFDHADIYGGGKSEELFSKAINLTPALREKMVLQSKCGIRKGMYDFSKEYIISSVDGILKRLNTEYIDILLLHRPDTLMEPEEVAEAFDYLETSGKVRHFGVSNHTPMQIELMKTAVKQDIIINQLQFSIAHSGILDAGLNANMTNPCSIDHDNAVLDYSRINKVTIQTWSSIQHGFFSGTFLDNEDYKDLNVVLERIANEQNVDKSAVAIAWILRHPAKMQAIVGTTNAQRLANMAKASDVVLSREQWYEIYRASGKRLP